MRVPQNTKDNFSAYYLLTNNKWGNSWYNFNFPQNLIY